MQLTPTEQQNMLETALARFIRESYSLSQRQAILATDQGFSEGNWDFLVELGLTGLPFGEEDGGYGGSLADVVAVMNQFGRGLMVEPFFPCVVVAGRLLAQTPDPTQKEQWLAPLIAGKALFGLAHCERGMGPGGPVSATRLGAAGDRFSLSGAKLLVPVPAALAGFLVTALDHQDRLRVCVLPVSTPGLEVRHYRCTDGQHMGELLLKDVVVSDQQILALPDPSRALDQVLTYADAALCGELVGIASALVETTLDYARTRRQFGRPIGSFQVIKHRLADCHAMLQQMTGMALLAGDDRNPDWPANVAAAKATIGACARHIGHEAIQMHGGMGLTDELTVSHYHKRLVTAAMLFSDDSACIRRFTGRADFSNDRLASSALPFDALLTPQAKALRAEVRAFLDRELTADLKTAVELQTVSFPEKDVAVTWQQKLNRRGWLAPLWPRDLGGTGWSPMERFVFEYETGVAGAPDQVPMGYRYVGPVIARFGSEWQKDFFLPKMLNSEHYWAQGFSEPGAGSDLAALKTTAKLDGNHYVINGSKMWTTHAHFANWLFCIARTEKTEKPQRGISFFLIDMNSPGIRVEPIPLLAVDHEVNQVFLDNVRVPVANLVGEPGQGWRYAKYLLELERGGTVFCGRLRREFNEVKKLINQSAPQLWDDDVLTHRLAQLEHRLMALEVFEFRNAATATDDARAVAGSMAKLLASELQKDITEMGAAVAGYGGLEMVQGRPLKTAIPEDFTGHDLELVAMPRYLNMRVASIYGGSSEIQREIIGKHALGLG